MKEKNFPWVYLRDESQKTALAYGALILRGLGTWWFDAVGTRSLSLEASTPEIGRAHV